MFKTSQFKKNRIVKFSHNWNEKLSCNSFSTIRLKNTSKYVKGEKYLIMLKLAGSGVYESLGVATLVGSSNFTLDQISDSMSYLDADMSKTSLVRMLQSMYMGKVKGIDSQFFNMLVFRWDFKEINFYQRLFPNHFT